MVPTAVLTRPAARNTPLAGRLQLAGWTVLCAPALDIVRLFVPNAQAYSPERYDLVIFVSGNAAQAYAAMLAVDGSPPAWPTHTAIAGVGAATLQAARLSLALPAQTAQYGPAPEATSYDSEALYFTLTRARVCPRRVLIVRGTTGREWLAARLRSDGAQVDTLAVYARSAAVWSEDVQATLQAWQAQGRAATWLYTSAEGLSCVELQARACGVGDWLASCAAVVTHPRLAGDLRSRPVSDERSAPTVKVCLPDDEAIFEAFVAV